MFIADVLGCYDVYKGPRNIEPAAVSGAQWPVNEPSLIVTPMAAATKNLTFGVTVATTYEQPYHLARRLSTLDHLTKGRVGWNIVTGYLDSAARNLGFSGGNLSHDERYAMAEEYLQVMYKLWNSSWRDDAVVLDAERGVYTEPSRIREINHKGKYYEVPGPHICQPSPQRTPVLLQAGTSKSGKQFAAQHAECIFVAGFSPQAVAKSVKEIRDMARDVYGRDPKNIKFLALMTPVLAETSEAAAKKFEDYSQYGSIEGALALFGGWTGIDLNKYGDDEELRQVESNAIRSAVEMWSRSAPGIPKWTKITIAKNITIGGLGPTVVGNPQEVADVLEKWVEEADVDGFNFVCSLSFSFPVAHLPSFTDSLMCRPTPSSPAPSSTSSSSSCLSSASAASSGTTTPSRAAPTARTSTVSPARSSPCPSTSPLPTPGRPASRPPMPPSPALTPSPRRRRLLRPLLKCSSVGVAVRIV